MGSGTKESLSDGLTELIQSAAHAEILSMAGDTMEPVSERVPGGPPVEFVCSRYDPGSGETIVSSWWLVPEPHFSTGEVPLVDLFDKKERLVVIVQFPQSQAL